MTQGSNSSKINGWHWRSRIQLYHALQMTNCFALLLSCQVNSERSLISARPKRAGKISDSRVCTCIFPLFCLWPKLQPIGSLRFSNVQVHFPALLYLAKISDQQTVFLSCRVFNHITSPSYCHLWGYTQNISIKRQRTNVIATSPCTTGILGGGGAIEVCGAPCKTREGIT